MINIVNFFLNTKDTKDYTKDTKGILDRRSTHIHEEFKSGSFSPPPPLKGGLEKRWISPPLQGNGANLIKLLSL